MEVLIMKKVDPKEFGLEENKVKSIEAAFTPKIIERDALKDQYEELITQELTEDICGNAKSLRLKLVKVRTGIADIHKTQKAFFLASGKFVDAWKNKETLPVTQMEEKLSDIESHFQKLEEQRRNELRKTRLNQLAQYGDDAEFIDLVNMPDDTFDKYLDTAKSIYLAKIQAEKELEEKRQSELKRIEDERIAKEKADKIERERIEKENKLLRKEADERDRKEKIEADKRAKVEASRIAKEEKERTIRDEKERKEREKQQAILKIEQDEHDRVLKELVAKKEAEQKADQERKAKIQADLNKGDTAKVRDLIIDLETLKTKYEFKSIKNKRLYEQVGQLLDKVASHMVKK